MARLDTQVAANFVDQEARAQGVDPAIARAIFLTENQGSGTVDTQTTSPAGAVGLMQVIPSTFNGLKKLGFLPKDATYDTPQAQIRAGVAAIKERMGAGISDPVELAVGFNGSPAVLAAYRAGKAIPEETVNYISKFKQNLGVGVGTTSERVTTKVIPPDAADAVAMSADRSASMTNDLLETLASLSNQITGNVKAQNKATQYLGETTGAAKLQAGEVDAGTIESRQGLLSAFGINLDATDPQAKRVLQTNLDQMIQSQEARAPIEQQIAQLKAVNPLKDPIGWLMGNFRAEGLKPQYNALVQTENAAAENLRAVQAVATSQAALQPANVAEAVRLKAYAEARMAQATAASKVEETKGTALQIIARNAIEGLNVANADTSQRLAVARMFAEQYSLGSSTSNKDDEINATLAPINLMRASVGLQPLTKDTIKLLGNKQREIWSEVGTNGRWGSDVAESVSNLHNFLGDIGIQKLTGDQAPLGEFLKAAVRGGNAELEAMRNSERKTGIPNPILRGIKDPEDQLRVGVKIWNDKIVAEQLYRDNSRMSPENPYKIDHSRAMNLPELQGNSTSKFLGEFAAANKGSIASVNDQLLWENAVAQTLNSPVLAPKMAHDLSEYYRVGTASKTMSIGMSQFGLEPAKEYPVKINNTVVDLLNPTAVENYLTQMTARRIWENNAAGVVRLQRPMN